MLRRRFLLTALALFGLTAVAAAQDQVELNWKFEKGKVFYQKQEIKTVQAMKVSGMDTNQTQDQTFTFSWEPVEQAADGSWTLKMKVTALKMNIDVAGNKIAFDSASPAGTNALQQFFTSVVGTEFKVTVAKDGKVSKVEGRDDFIKKIGAVNAQMTTLLTKVLSDDAMKQMSDPTFGISPGKPVKKGDTWDKKQELNLGPVGAYTVTTKYTLENIDNGTAKIKSEPKLEFKAANDQNDGLPFRIKSATLKPKPGTGDAEFDTKAGRLKRQTSKVEFEGELDIEIGGQSAKVEVRQDQTTTVTTSDTDPDKTEKK